MNNKGIFYVLTATEIQHVNTVIQDLMSVSNPSEYDSEGAHQALEILAKSLNTPLDTDEVVSALGDEVVAVVETASEEN